MGWGHTRQNGCVTYLDHAASTPVRAEAVEAMLPFLTERYGNPSGAHAMARDARNALDDARATLADALGCRPGEIVFTSGGTEADNAAIFSFPDRGAVVCSAIEHHAVLDPVHRIGGRVVGRGLGGGDEVGFGRRPALVIPLLLSHWSAAPYPTAPSLARP